jgi:hypothetical protein
LIHPDVFDLITLISSSLAPDDLVWRQRYAVRKPVINSSKAPQVSKHPSCLLLLLYALLPIGLSQWTMLLFSNAVQTIIAVACNGGNASCAQCVPELMILLNPITLV